MGRRVEAGLPAEVVTVKRLPECLTGAAASLHLTTRMSSFPILFAIDPIPSSSGSHGASTLAGDGVLIMGIGVLMALVLFGGVWLYFRPKSTRRDRSRRRSSAPAVRQPKETAEVEEGQTDVEEGGTGGGGHRRRRRKVMRRDHRPRNPTLAETGGLPPLKSSGGGGGSPGV